MKRIMTIQDISCIGKCSLTVALPVISAMGVETAVIPTAVLSTHTGGFKDYTFRDLTSDIPGIADHWNTLGMRFDGMYTGYLGSIEQIKIVSDIFDMFTTDENFIVVDPAMADSGRLYAGFTGAFVDEMKKLCAKADYIIPNMTEACFMLGLDYDPCQTEDSVKEMLKRLTELGCPTPVLTGVRFDDKSHGAALYDSANDHFYFSFREHVDRTVHGTGDIFASVFTGAVTLGKSLGQALDICVNYTADCIQATLPYADEVWYGTCFESCLGKLIDYTRNS